MEGVSEAAMGVSGAAMGVVAVAEVGGSAGAAAAGGVEVAMTKALPRKS